LTQRNRAKTVVRSHLPQDAANNSEASLAPLLIRHESTAAAAVQGYKIPVETALFINRCAVGRDPAVWGETADEFRPEHILGVGGGAAPWT
jgi:hypothetical protein